ncbi:CRISPR system precrRNA processing endoribonuclease RAMP protein Cas6 [Oscillochloris sp. ZM17-4]|uniref:CRISPR system precrRNA processing endoribonuclease RAMP protein Cas6 n=1 Tax=Oscillochloris sp. ZM17-4 TaxID=2866714 RepID=UPI001C733955|nr:CRISPR system precrRNA processing endoribonuclease RAMP protein Cas6 [Oscillochloris sp. ZM17-4]MBX0329720.1 CRISPR system precrRNA processing endoribonuclease RAMP protein Cas6 [Oscillochloris sp. ZM17-4]
MPTALVFTLRPKHAARVPSGMGRVAHAMVMELIAASDPDLAARLHTANELRPITVSNPLSRPDTGGESHVRPERSQRLRVTLLTAETEDLADAWLAAPPEELRFGGVDWAVERITARARADSWAGGESYTRLMEQALQRAERGPGRWTLEFSSPVSFRQRGLCQPLPTPELVFGSLLDRWNACAPLPLPGEVRRYAAESLVASKFDLRTGIEVSKNGVPQVGVLGRCTYIAREHDPLLAGCIEALAQFAFYSGIGAGTARGLGQARAIASGDRAPAPGRARPAVA